MASFISIRFANMRRNAHLEENKDENHVEKHLLKKSTSSSDITIEERIIAKKMELKIMLVGKLDNPKIECLKELYHSESDSKIIPLGVKKS